MDSAVVDFLYRWASRSSLAEDIMVASATLPVFVLVALLLLTTATRTSCAACAARILKAGAASALALGISALVHIIYYRPRPFVAERFTPLIRHSQDSSFFSSHLSVAGAVVVSLWLVDRRMGVVALLLSLIMAFGRATSGLHYPSDLFVGLVVGGIASLLLHRLTPRDNPPEAVKIGATDEMA